MSRPVPVRSRPRPALVRGLAPRFALMMCDPRVAAAPHMSCVEDTIEVRYPESHISCRLLRLSFTGSLLCAFRVTHLDLDGSAEEPHRLDLVLDGTPGSAAQCEALLQRLHAFRCAAIASRVRLATRVLRPESPTRGPLDHAYLAAA
ncbi:hypothetical protein AB0H86_32860 [Streptomyces sp. NPDC050997]|uniref:hypothetical protein n=1 Tax=Streptomyces sp. NPDC050997 TaxID=3155519 RepID=UPI00342F0BBD